MRLPRRSFLKATTVSLATAGLCGRTPVAAHDTKKVDLVVTFGGLCAFVPERDAFKVGLVNAEYNEPLKLHTHVPILVVPAEDVVDCEVGPEKDPLPDHVASWTDLDASVLKWWCLKGRCLEVLTSRTGPPTKGLDRVGSIDRALDGRGFDYPGRNPLHPMWWEKKKGDRKLISSLVTLRGGKIRNGPARIKNAESIEWQFQDALDEKAHEQRLTDTVEYQLNVKQQVHVVAIDSKKICVSTKNTELDAKCWILNVPHTIEDEPKPLALRHFAAFYDLLRYEIANNRRPVPTTDFDYVGLSATERAESVDPPTGYDVTTSDSVYCPGSVF